MSAMTTGSNLLEPLTKEEGSRIGNAAQSLLRQSNYLDLHGLECDYEDGIVTIKGRVPSFYLKQVAHSIVSRVSGVRQVCDETEVETNS